MKVFNKVLAFALVALMGLTGCNAQSASVSRVEVPEFEKAITDDNVVLVDVRTASEYADGHIEGAINMDVQKDDFESVAVKTLPKGATVAIYCRSGNRSRRAAEILQGKGFNVVELSTGFNGWSAAGKNGTKEEVDLFLTPGGISVYLYCIKHGTIRMKIGGKWIHVDPVSKGAQPVTDYSVMPKADVILVTHEHGDHLDAGAIADLTKDGTVLIANSASQAKLGKGEVMKNGDSRSVAGIEIKAVPAYNNSEEKQNFHPKGNGNGYVLTVDGFCIYIAGDTEDIPEMKELKKVDVAFLPCNLPYTMTPEQLANAARSFSPKVVFPYHYGQTEIQQTVSLLSGSGIEVRIRQYQ